jgi:TetR/AcrR family transcriptional regulator, cholesterol catabolism regulator
MNAGQLARRRRVLDAVHDLLVDLRIDQFQVRDVADRSGVALGTIYRYFSSKEHLLAEVLDDWASGYRPTAAAPSSPRDGDPHGTAGPAAPLVAALRRGLRAYEREPQYAALLLATAATSDVNARRIYTSMGSGVSNQLRDALCDLDEQRAAAVARVVGAVWFNGLFDVVNERRSFAEVEDALVEAAVLAVDPDAPLPTSAADPR